MMLLKTIPCRSFPYCDKLCAILYFSVTLRDVNVNEKGSARIFDEASSGKAISAGLMAPHHLDHNYSETHDATEMEVAAPDGHRIFFWGEPSMISVPPSLQTSSDLIPWEM